MTNLEALIANLASPHGIVLDSSSFQKVLIDRDVNPDASYVKANAQVIDLCTVDLYKMVLGSSNLSEGNLSYTNNQKDSVKQVIDSLLVKLGLPQEFGTQNIISSCSPW
jgi:uncharacterized protein YjbI with pentapeptide repeats